MGMDFSGAVLSPSEVREISDNIKVTADNIVDIMKSVHEVMGIITNDGEGSLIQQLQTATVQLTDLCLQLIDSVKKIVDSILNFLQSMINNDREAEQTLNSSTQSRVYAN